MAAVERAAVTLSALEVHCNDVEDKEDISGFLPVNDCKHDDLSLS